MTQTDINRICRKCWGNLGMHDTAMYRYWVVDTCRVTVLYREHKSTGEQNRVGFYKR